MIFATQLTKQGELEGYDAYVFGSATYHGEMMQAMKTLLFLAAKLDLDGKVGGSSALLAGVAKRRTGFTIQCKTSLRWT